MLEFITSETIANEVSMLRMSMHGPIVLVEGKTDTRVYRRFFLPAPHVRLIYCAGKPALRDAMGKIRSRRMQSGVMGICDADYDRVLFRRAGENIFFADLHDAETMICYSDSFERVFEELFEHEPSQSELQRVRDGLLRIAAKIGAVRLWNEQNNAHLKFSGVNIGKHLASGMNFNMLAYFAEVIENSSSSTASADDLMRVADEGREENSDAEMATGHDFCALLAAETRLVRAENDYWIGPGTVESMLRLSFDNASFVKTELALSLARWEELSGLELLKAEACPGFA